jgi:hypothetical protein
MKITDVTLIRLGVLAFPIAGLVDALGALVPGIGINPTIDPAGFAQTANLLGLVNLAGLLTLLLLLYGFQALNAILANAPARRCALAGMLLSIAGAALYASFLGIFAFVAPIAGRQYLNGQTQAISIMSEATSVSNPTALGFGGVSELFYILGSILFSISMWRSGKIPKWSSVAYAVSAPLNVTPHFIPALWFTEGILLLGAGLGIVRVTWKKV